MAKNYKMSLACSTSETPYSTAPVGVSGVRAERDGYELQSEIVH